LTDVMRSDLQIAERQISKEDFALSCTVKIMGSKEQGPGVVAFRFGCKMRTGRAMTFVGMSWPGHASIGKEGGNSLTTEESDCLHM